MISLEPLFEHTPAARNFEALIRLVLDTGAITAGIRWGVATLTWPGGAQGTNVATVPHGLGRAPVIVLATPTSPPVAAWTWTGAYGATSFPLAGQTSAAAPVAGTTMSVAWLAIG